MLYKLNNDPEIILSEFSYDELGHLAQNLLHNGKDEIEYLYDMRNMLSMTYNKHFSEELYYADHVKNVPFATPYYNGNIAAVSYLQGDSTYTFAYEYDGMNRLIESKCKFKGKVQPCEWFKYDARGNILQLQRHSGPRLIDDLRMTYQEDGNQLLSVSDDGNGGDLYGMIDYEDGHNADGDNLADMRYDVNGNLIADKDRGIRIRYNMLNLPDTIQFGYGGHQIVNHYDANGRKYKSIVYTNIDPGMSYYDDIAHYTYDMDSIYYRVTEYNGNIETYYTPEDTTYRVYNSIGYYDSKTNAYYHYIKDHLGNVSAVVNSQADTMIQSTIYYASGVPMMESKGITEKYYMAKGAQPNQNFGRDEQPYLYNGKEFIEAHGLNEYDSQARRYYATIMRTTTMDPLAEMYYHISPYAWCGNDPVNRFDPDGRKWKTKRDLQIAQRLAKSAYSKAIKHRSRLNKLEEKRYYCNSEKKLARIDKKMADEKTQIERLGKLQGNIKQLTETEKNTYTFNTVDGNKTLALLERADDGTIIINNYGYEGSQVHELTHAAQYENGKLKYVGSRTIFRPTVAGGFLEIETEAYQTEYSISGEVPQSDKGDVESVTDIDAEWVSGVYSIDDKGNKIYPYKEYWNPTTSPLSGVSMPWRYEPQILGL